MNKEKIQVSEATSAKKEKKPNMAAARKYVKWLNVFGIFNKESLVSVMPFVFFLMLLAMVYIANTYQAERTIREIDSIGKELKTLRTEEVAGKSELMQVSKQTDVARLVSPLGIKEATEAPRKIMVQPIKSTN